MAISRLMSLLIAFPLTLNALAPAYSAGRGAVSTLSEISKLSLVNYTGLIFNLSDEPKLFKAHIRSVPEGVPIKLYLRIEAGDQLTWRDRTPKDVKSTAPFVYAVWFPKRFRIGGLIYAFDHLEVNGEDKGYLRNWQGSITATHREEVVIAHYKALLTPAPPDYLLDGDGDNKGRARIPSDPIHRPLERYAEVTFVMVPHKGHEVRGIYMGRQLGIPVMGFISGRTNFTVNLGALTPGDYLYCWGAIGSVREGGTLWWPVPGAWNATLTYAHPTAIIKVTTISRPIGPYVPSP